MAYDPDEAEFARIMKAAEDWPRPNIPKDFAYGTAGFRMRADIMEFVCFTVGLLAQLRSRKCHGNVIGIMITASHNPAEDNGVKIVDPMGEMLASDWEWYASGLANARTPEMLRNGYMHCINRLKIDQNQPRTVIIARDTRPSGARLVKAVVAALEATNCKYIDYGFLTTPQLHYLVRATNTQNSDRPYGEVSEEGYYKKLSEAFTRSMHGAGPVKGPVWVDCANGVGAPKLKELIKHLPEGLLKINVVNDKIENPDMLNHRCGADWVKVQQRVPPESFTGKDADRWAALDGDADRLIYFYVNHGNCFRMLDGDRIASLAATFIGDLVKKAGLANQLQVAVVQTAYANGNSTKYVTNRLRLEVECTATGVKHLHHVAAHKDIGVYFEANGHGTVLFNERALKAFRKHRPESPAQLEAIETLKALTDLINQTVGDALADLLLVEVILAQKDWHIEDWLLCYDDLPNKLAKCHVIRRESYTTVPDTAERKLKTPPGVQEKIDEIVNKFREGRAFVRASGTEDAVRIYGEAAEPYDVENMVGMIHDMISHHSGEGVRPTVFVNADRYEREEAWGLRRDPPEPAP